MRRKIWKPDLDATAELIQKLDENEIETFFQKVFHVSSLEEVIVKLIKTEEQRKKVLELLQQDGETGSVSLK